MILWYFVEQRPNFTKSWWFKYVIIFKIISSGKLFSVTTLIIFFLLYGNSVHLTKKNILSLQKIKMSSRVVYVVNIKFSDIFFASWKSFEVSNYNSCGASKRIWLFIYTESSCVSYYWSIAIDTWFKFINANKKIKNGMPSLEN